MQCARVLIVDDEEGIRETLRAVLEDERFLVDAAENGQDAMRNRRPSSTIWHWSTSIFQTRMTTLDTLGGNHSEDGQLKCTSSISRYYGLARK